MRTKHVLTDSFFSNCTSTEGPITISSENIPDSQSSLIGKNIIIYSNNRFKVLIYENIHITQSYLRKELTIQTG